MNGELRRRVDGLAAALEVPLLIVTVRTVQGMGGCLVAFHTQTSIQPHGHLVGLSPRNRTTRLARGATHLAVHTVPAGRRDLAVLFGGSTGDDHDKFARCAWRPWDDGTPLLEGAGSWMVGRITSWHPLGDHDGALLHPVAASPPPAGPLLTTVTLGRLEPGHPP